MPDIRQPKGTKPLFEPNGPSIVIPIEFEQPLAPWEQSTIERVAMLMMVHNFELHDIKPEGEQISHIPAGEHVLAVEPQFNPDDSKKAEVSSRLLRATTSSIWFGHPR